MEAVCKYMLAVEARLRELEGLTFQQVHINVEGKLEGAIQAAKCQGELYAEVSKGKPGQFGSPHLHIAMAFLEALTKADLGTSFDVKKRQVALEIFHKMVCSLSMSEATAVIRSFRIADMYQKKDQAKKVRLVTKVEGRMILPSKEMVKELEEAKEPDRRAAKLEEVAGKLVAYEEAEFHPAEGRSGRALRLEEVLIALLCVSGGTRAVGKAPRGGYAYTLHKLIQSS